MGNNLQGTNLHEQERLTKLSKPQLNQVQEDEESHMEILTIKEGIKEEEEET